MGQARQIIRPCRPASIGEALACICLSCRGTSLRRRVVGSLPTCTSPPAGTRTAPSTWTLPAGLNPLTGGAGLAYYPLER